MGGEEEEREGREVGWDGGEGGEGRVEGKEERKDGGVDRSNVDEKRTRIRREGREEKKNTYLRRRVQRT